MLSLKIEGFNRSAQFKSVEDLEDFKAQVEKLNYSIMVNFGPFGIKRFSGKFEFTELKKQILAELERLVDYWKQKERERKVKSG